MKRFLFLLFAISLSVSLYAQPFLQVPIEGNQGEEWIIVNYVDWETTGYLDHSCGTKSYDGHQGTDFTIRSFAAMDDSIAVYAADAGRVTYTIDSLFDRETEGDVTKQLGNYIALSHSNDFYTYYGHLMQNSIQVEVGDSVEIGELIGYVGSSGNSTDPHLHFELWYDSLYVVDPFAGDCGNAMNSFIDPPAYDTSLTVWESGIHLKNNLTINDLRERITTIEQPFEIKPTSDSSLYFWSHLYGLRKDKELTIEWYTPNNTEWFEFSITLDQDYWYYYYWSYIDHTDLTVGVWKVRLIYDGTEIASESFEVTPLTSIGSPDLNNECQEYENWSMEQFASSADVDLQLFNINGQVVLKNGLSKFPSGIYFLHIRRGNEFCVFKRWID